MAAKSADQEWREEIELAIAQLAAGLRQQVNWRPEQQQQVTLEAVVRRARERHAAKEPELETRPHHLPERRAG
jgi:hypothetical protein